MSYDVMVDQIEPCPCGNGTQRYVSEMNDWNTTRSSTTIFCPKCKQDEIDARIKRNAELNRERELTEYVLQYFTENYLMLWINIMDEYKTKTDKYNYIKSVGLRLPYHNVSTFNRKFKKDEIATVCVTPYNLLKLLDILGVVDDDYVSIIDELLVLKNISDSIAYNNMYRRARWK